MWIQTLIVHRLTQIRNPNMICFCSVLRGKVMFIHHSSLVFWSPLQCSDGSLIVFECNMSQLLLNSLFLLSLLYTQTHTCVTRGLDIVACLSNHLNVNSIRLGRPGEVLFHSKSSNVNSRERDSDSDSEKTKMARRTWERVVLHMVVVDNSLFALWAAEDLPFFAIFFQHSVPLVYFHTFCWFLLVVSHLITGLLFLTYIRDWSGCISEYFLDLLFTLISPYAYSSY